MAVLAYDHLAQLLAGLTLATLVVIELVDLRALPPDHEHDQNTMGWFNLAYQLGLATGIVALVVRPESAIPGGWLVFGTGFAVAWAGIALNRWARHTLGRFYAPVVTIQAGHRIVVEGPYRWVRHPMYLGVVGICVGGALMLGTWIGFVAASVLPLAALVQRIRVEERVLREELGDGYLAFATRRGRLFPRVR